MSGMWWSDQAKVWVRFFSWLRSLMASEKSELIGKECLVEFKKIAKSKGYYNLKGLEGNYLMKMENDRYNINIPIN